MKYIITESKINNMIKEYILNNYNDVVDVEFETKRIALGSGPNEKGETVVYQKVIMITLDNVKNKKTSPELREESRKIASTLEGLFGIDFKSYGSEWDLRFYLLKKVEL
jgi:hypothetical protein